MVLDHALHAGLAPGGPVLLGGALHGHGREGERTRGRVQQGDRPLAVGQAGAGAKAALQYGVNAVHDVAHHRLGGVVHATPLAQGGVVLSQEGLVKVNDGVGAVVGLLVLAQDAAHVGRLQHGGDLVERDLQVLGQVDQGNVPEDLAQHPQGTGDVIVSQLAVELALGAYARGKHAVGEGLSKQVGELVGTQVGDERSLEDVEKPG